MNKRILWLFGIGISVLGLVLWPGRGNDIALAHGGAALTVSPVVVAAGAEITVKGEGVEAGETFTIALAGLNFEATLGTVTVGDDEDFHQEFSVPSDTPPGTYQLRAVSEEGETLTTELSVKAGADAETSPAAPAEPSAEWPQLERPRPPGQLAIIIGGLATSAVLGLWLVRKKES